MNQCNITEIFSSIQGEGPKIGWPTTFVRFYGCNLVCPFCDSLYSVNTEQNNIKKMSIKEVENTIIDLKIKDVTFTGGEPFLYFNQIKEIISDLSDYSYSFETNGLIFNNEIIKLPYKVMYVVSPKLHAINDKYKESLKRWTSAYNESGRFVCFKFVYENQKTIEQIQDLDKEIEFGNIPIYLMPEGKLFDNNKYLECVEKCMQHGYKISPRLHIILWGNKRGV